MSNFYSEEHMTLEEAWSGKKPNVGYFRIFGCLVYSHVSDVQRIKLDAKIIKCVMLRVSEESKAYRCTT